MSRYDFRGASCFSLTLENSIESLGPAHKYDVFIREGPVSVRAW